MLVTIARYSFPYEAHITKSKLEAMGVPAFIADEHTVNMQWLYSSAMGGVRLQVLQEQAAEAIELLKEDNSENLVMESAATEPAPVCSKCGGVLSEPYQTGRRTTIFSFLLLGLPLWFVKWSRKCTSCSAVSRASTP
jgi:hypothetical protein